MLEQSTITEIKKAIDLVSNQDGDGNIVVKASKQKKTMPVINPFVICFHKSLYEIIETFALSRSAIRLLLLVLDSSALGNLVSINQTHLAKCLGTSKSGISRYMKELKTCGIILETDRGLFLNPQVISKGSLISMSENAPLTASAIQRMKDMGLPINYGSPSQIESYQG